ncbi:unnamed protein product, partial [Timema podura]|nr:unnamed protein product [Timema podura]
GSGRLDIEEIEPHLRGGMVENNLGETSFNTPYQDSNPHFPVISHLFCCEGDTLGRLATERGGDCMVLPNLSEKEATSLFPKGFSVTNLPSGKPYLRVTPQP